MPKWCATSCATVIRTSPTTSITVSQDCRTRILTSLRTADLVLRTAHPTDGRQVIYTATDAARAMVDRDRKRRDQWLLHRLELLSPSEITTLEQAIPILNRLALD